MSAPDDDLELVRAGYDAVYGALSNSPTFRSLWREHAHGSDYPDGFENISFLTKAELSRFGEALQGRETLADLGCGEGGPGLWVAREAGAQLIGVDLSPVAVANAAAHADRLGLAGTARFTTGAFDDTGLEPASVQAAMSVDALQYAPDKRAAFEEVHRILSPGGRFVFTAFEVSPERVSGLPVIGSDPADDFRPHLERAGFLVEVYEETPSWRPRLVAAYQAVVDHQADLSAEMTEEAVGPLLMEVGLTLAHDPYQRRVLAMAVKS